MANDLVERILKWADVLDLPSGKFVNEDLRETAARITELEAALTWYGEQARLCRLIHSEGDAGRHALSKDGGERAARALSAKLKLKK